jgi:hypothetical protein
MMTETTHNPNEQMEIASETTISSVTRHISSHDDASSRLEEQIADLRREHVVERQALVRQVQAALRADCEALARSIAETEQLLGEGVEARLRDARRQVRELRELNTTDLEGRPLFDGRFLEAFERQVQEGIASVERIDAMRREHTYLANLTREEIGDTVLAAFIDGHHRFIAGQLRTPEGIRESLTYLAMEMPRLSAMVAKHAPVHVRGAGPLPPSTARERQRTARSGHNPFEG